MSEEEIIAICDKEEAEYRAEVMSKTYPEKIYHEIEMELGQLKHYYKHLRVKEEKKF